MIIAGLDVDTILHIVFMRKYSKFTDYIRSENFTNTFSQNTNNFQKSGGSVTTLTFPATYVLDNSAELLITDRKLPSRQILVPRTSRGLSPSPDVLWRSDLTPWARPNLTSWRRPEMTSRKRSNLTLKDFPGRLIQDVPSGLSKHSN